MLCKKIHLLLVLLKCLHLHTFYGLILFMGFNVHDSEINIRKFNAKVMWQNDILYIQHVKNEFLKKYFMNRYNLFHYYSAHHFILIKAWCNFSWHQSKHNYSHINWTKGRFRSAISLWRLISSCKKCDDRTINHHVLCISRYSGCKNNSSIWLNLYGIVQQHSNYNMLHF